MKSIKIVFIALLFGCQPTENCDLKEILFPKPSEDALVFALDDIWVYSDSIKDVICEAGLSSLYLCVDSTYLHYSSEVLTNSCSDIISCGSWRRRNRLEVLINSENSILMEGQVIDLQQVDSMFVEVYLNPNHNTQYFERTKNSAIEIKWDINANREKVKAVINKLLKGYTNVIRLEYPTASGTALCNSIKTNLEKL